MNDVKWGPLGETVYARTYSRPKADGTNETWPETVERVVDGNLDLAGVLAALAGDDRDALIERMGDFRILPAGRHLWASGAKSKLGLFNCWRAGWGPALADHFVFTFDQLMLGGGVGANYGSDYLRPLEKPVTELDVRFRMAPSHPDRKAFVDSGLKEESGTRSSVFFVEDSREGWVYALRLLFMLAVTPNAGRAPVKVVFDVSGVRGYGAPILGFGGTASGPGPLMHLLAAVAGVLNGAVGRQVTPIEAMQIDHEIASCVVAGNVRRSARMSILHWKDPHVMEFLECKSDGVSHWSTNLSVEVDSEFWNPSEMQRGHRDRVLRKVAEGMHRNGEPGFYNSELAAVGERGDVRATNPCGEITLEAWEQCNLGHVNLAHPAHQDPDHLLESFRLMARFTTRATLGETSSARSKVVKDNNRRIGVGVFGFQEWLAAQGLRFSDVGTEYNELALILNGWRDAVREAADAAADAYGFARPVKVTTVAPTGSIAKLPGVTEGIHPVYAKRFVRRVRYALHDAELARLKAEGHPVEPCKYSANTEVVSFYVQDAAVERFGDLIEDVSELSLNEMMQVQALFQSEFADNAVSFTANFDPGVVTVEELEAAVLRWGRVLKGTTAFPEMGMEQSPMERLSEEDWISVGSVEVGQSLDDSCASGACPVR